MDTIISLIHSLECKNIALLVVDGRLVARAEPDALSDEDMQMLKENKEVILTYLQQKEAAAAEQEERSEIQAAIDARAAEVDFGDNYTVLQEWAVLQLPDWLGGGYDAIPADAYRDIAAHNAAARERWAKKQHDTPATNKPKTTKKSKAAKKAAAAKATDQQADEMFSDEDEAP